MKIFILSILILVSLHANAFHTKIYIKVQPADAEIYINDVFQGKGEIVFPINKAKKYTVRIQRIGYVTERHELVYKAYFDSDFVWSYRRHKTNNKFSVSLNVIEKNTNEQPEQKQDVVYLKDGNIIKGEITEQIINVSVKIETKDGNIFVYKMSDILNITYKKAK